MTTATKQASPADMRMLQKWMPSGEYRTILSNMRGEEGDSFSEIMAILAERIRTMPKTYDQDGLGDQAVVHLHYFVGGSDWWITEKDREAEQHQAFGLADLFGDGGELGYISIVEITQCGAELDLYWTPKTLAEIRGKRG